MTEIKSILYPFELSQIADESLWYSVAMAISCDAKLYLCNCVDSLARLSETERDRINQQFRKKVDLWHHAGTSWKIEWEGLILEGNPAEAISRVAAEKHIELIVMRSRRRAIAATILGSTAEAICRDAPCPVMVTHESPDNRVDPETMKVDLKRVLVAYDFSDDSEIALRYALSFADRHNAQLHVLHVLTSRMLSPKGYTDALPAGVDTDYGEAMRRLQRSLPPAPQRNGNVKLSISEGHPYREALSYAQEQGIDLICMGAHGAGHGINSLFGSNVDRVLRQSPCPVFVARPLRPYIGEIPRSMCG